MLKTIIIIFIIEYQEYLIKNSIKLSKDIKNNLMLSFI